MTEMNDNHNSGLFMKIHLLAIVIILLFSGCALNKKNVKDDKSAKEKAAPKIDPQIDRKIVELGRLNDWFSYIVARNKVQKSLAFTQPYFRSGIYFEMYYDEEELKNYYYYDQKLHVDLGWVQNQRTALWEKTAKSKPINEGVLYINPATKVALYYYPNKDGEFDVFLVRIKKVEPPPEPVTPEDPKAKDAKAKDDKSKDKKAKDDKAKDAKAKDDKSKDAKAKDDKSKDKKAKDTKK